MGFPSAICLYSGNHSNHHLPDLILSSPVLKECWTRGWDLGGGSLKWTPWTSPLRSLGLGLLCSTAALSRMSRRALSPRNEHRHSRKKKKSPKPISTGKLWGAWSAFLLCPVCAISATCLRQRELRVNQLLRRQIVKTVTELRGGKAGLCWCMGQTQAFQTERAPTMAPRELLGLDQCHWTSQELPRRTPQSALSPTGAWIGKEP